MIGKIIEFIVVTTMFFAIATASLYIYIQDYQNAILPNKKILFIPKGSTKSIVKYLNTKGYDLTLIDYYLIKEYGYPQAGWIDLQSENLRKRDFFYRLTHSRAVGLELKIIPGETTYFILEDIAKKFKLSVTKLHTFYEKFSPIKEGVIFSDTYSFYKGINEEEIMKLLIEESLKKHKKIAEKFLKNMMKKSGLRNILL